MFFRKQVTVIVVFLVIFSSLSYANPGKWREARFGNEVIIIKDHEFQSKEGQIFSEKNDRTHIIAADDLGKAGEVAVNDLMRYIQLSCGCRIRSFKEESKES